jgi:segregation and condensation protein A
VPVLAVDGFEGPLDWLLEMAQARKIDLAHLSIGALIQAFATAMEAALARRTDGRATELGRWGGWLVMAATLAFLCSRLLLPGDSPEAKAAEDEAEALRRRLISRAQLRAAADWLERRPHLGRDVFGRGTGQRHDGGDRINDITELLRACLVALRVPPEQADVGPRACRAGPFVTSWPSKPSALLLAGQRRVPRCCRPGIGQGRGIWGEKALSLAAPRRSGTRITQS